ncbi:DUF6480 family protein [Streptomyces sp. LE64]|uniref:DUF6480 family protein n=1 Tax=unclassified Streptomyces TaxID=2593676 RepID=UPI003331234F
MNDANGRNPGEPVPGARPDPRGGVPPGETPPAESGTGPATGPREDTERGWAALPLTLILIVALVFAAFFLVYALTLAL